MIIIIYFNKNVLLHKKYLLKNLFSLCLGLELRREHKEKIINSPLSQHYYLPQLIISQSKNIYQQINIFRQERNL